MFILVDCVKWTLIDEAQINIEDAIITKQLQHAFPQLNSIMYCQTNIFPKYTRHCNAQKSRAKANSAVAFCAIRPSIRLCLMKWCANRLIYCAPTKKGVSKIISKNTRVQIKTNVMANPQFRLLASGRPYDFNVRFMMVCTTWCLLSQADLLLPNLDQCKITPHRPWKSYLILLALRT